ncbi:hypothetical protein [Francisella sp. Scap27]|uniref:hypothetical protein n=1 Tax=Francisella sp. Scap27 TaxID=2589986 RepID=UPI002117B971|nr:hypothetical protein [Francisella sp. Scap27]
MKQNSKNVDIRNIDSSNEAHFVIKVLALSVFVVCFFVIVAIYTYVFARIQNSTIFFKFLDVIGIPQLSPILSFLWLLSIPVLLVCLFALFKAIWFKRIFSFK